MRHGIERIVVPVRSPTEAGVCVVVRKTAGQRDSTSSSLPDRRLSVKRQLVSVASAVWLSCGVIPAVGGGEIVLANRSLQAQGTSHSQLFLYREDGTLLRQLTRDNSGQMIDPIFAPDGETIRFHPGGRRSQGLLEHRTKRRKSSSVAPSARMVCLHQGFTCIYQP